MQKYEPPHLSSPCSRDGTVVTENDFWMFPELPYPPNN